MNASNAGAPSLSRPLPETVVVGRVIRPHGLQGEVVVEVLSDVEERFGLDSELLAIWPTGRRRKVRVVGARAHKARLLVRFDDCTDRDSAEGLRGAWLEIDRSQVPPPPDGGFYYFQLLDCHCQDAHLGDLGAVVEILEDGGGVLLRVKEGKRELLVPFVERFLRKVDIQTGVIEVALPPGLVETCGFES